MKMTYILLLLIFLVGCSYQEVYEGIQSANRIECSKLPPSQQEECMEETNKSYDEYERERKEILDE